MMHGLANVKFTCSEVVAYFQNKNTHLFHFMEARVCIRVYQWYHQLNNQKRAWTWVCIPPAQPSMLPGYKKMKCSYLMLIRYCASATASGLPVIVMVLSVLPPSRSSQFEMRIIAPLICLDRKEKSRHLFLVYLTLSKIIIAMYNVINGLRCEL